jgi:D-glycero-D-manno-heptose 1,7-bisphosphate phosphatase
MPLDIMGKRAVFLDRDDTLIENVPYLGDPAKVKLMPGAAEALLQFRKANLTLVVISNQSGVGRGYITKAQVRSVDARMEELLGGGQIFAHYGHCFAAPGDPYDDSRKPSPKMIQEAGAKLGIELERSFMVGNRLSDIQAGRSAKCKTVLLKLYVPPDEVADADKLASFSAPNWDSAKEWILKEVGKS